MFLALEDFVTEDGVTIRAGITRVSRDHRYVSQYRAKFRSLTEAEVFPSGAKAREQSSDWKSAATTTTTMEDPYRMSLQEELARREAWLREIWSPLRASGRPRPTTNEDLFWQSCERFVNEIHPRPDDTETIALMDQLDEMQNQSTEEFNQASRMWFGHLGEEI